jgi:hypothetical protein
MNQSGVFGLKFAELDTITCKADLDKIEHVDYYTSLNSIVARQQAKLMTELN